MKASVAFVNVASLVAAVVLGFGAFIAMAYVLTKAISMTGGFSLAGPMEVIWKCSVGSIISGVVHFLSSSTENRACLMRLINPKNDKDVASVMAFWGSCIVMAALLVVGGVSAFALVANLAASAIASLTESQSMTVWDHWMFALMYGVGSAVCFYLAYIAAGSNDALQMLCEGRREN